ncbi:MAG: L-aspartate oxidase [Desulfitobacteriaceae bacterium]|nr:L-aspartate oxidase [Desulfitobacteriaceae bacterium]
MVNVTEISQADVLVLGSGIAGLYTAIQASREQAKVVVLTKKTISESNTGHAQGGIAVALDEEDSPALHYEDTLYAGAGLCNSEAVRILVEEGPKRVEELMALGAVFDHQGASLAFTREGAHSRPRVLHAQGDATGWEIERALVQEAGRTPRLEVREARFLLDLLRDEEGTVRGALVFNPLAIKLEVYLAKAIVMATGGLGQVFGYTTNPDVATGDGMAAAFRVGAELMDMEFMQFHPTALLLPEAPRFLLSEAVRGEGAHLLNARRERFMKGIPGEELAPRDVVARAIWSEMASGPVYLDFRPIGSNKVAERFPKIRETCLHFGIDVLKDPVPVAPAAHYAMGGIRTNCDGQTNLPHLYACGECACNGVHGANRLASNSLLDGLVFGARIVAHMQKEKDGVQASFKDIEPYTTDGGRIQRPKGKVERAALQHLMWKNVGILREDKGLREAVSELQLWGDTYEPQMQVSDLELANMLLIGSLIAKSALSRKESRGSHFRLDFSEHKDPRWQVHSVIDKEEDRVRYIPVE